MKKRKRKGKRRDKPPAELPATPPKPNIPPEEQALLADIYRTFRKMYSRASKGRPKRKRTRKDR